MKSAGAVLFSKQLLLRGARRYDKLMRSQTEKDMKQYARTLKLARNQRKDEYRREATWQQSAAR